MTVEKSNLDSFFNLPPLTNEDESVEKEEIVDWKKTKDELMEEANTVFASLSTSDKIDRALPIVDGLAKHEVEMDQIRDKALKTFEDLVNLGGNVPDMHAGKIYEVSSAM